jgi:hypothetical protein
MYQLEWPLLQTSVRQQLIPWGLRGSGLLLAYYKVLSNGLYLEEYKRDSAFMYFD